MLTKTMEKTRNQMRKSSPIPLRWAQRSLATRATRSRCLWTWTRPLMFRIRTKLRPPTMGRMGRTPYTPTTDTWTKRWIRPRFKKSRSPSSTSRHLSHLIARDRPTKALRIWSARSKLWTARKTWRLPSEKMKLIILSKSLRRPRIQSTSLLTGRQELAQVEMIYNKLKVSSNKTICKTYWTRIKASGR